MCWQSQLELHTVMHDCVPVVGDLDGAANLLMASTSEERPSTPDRPDFERQLSELNDQISKCHKELNELLGKHGMESELRRQIGLLRESKQLRDTEKIAARRQEPEIDTIKKELAEKVRLAFHHVVLTCFPAFV